MSPRSFILLGAATLACLVLAGWSVAHRSLPGSGAAVDQPLAPELAGRLDDVALVSVTADGATTTIRRGDKGWTVDQAGGYPADPAKIRELALALANTRLLEAKTAQAKLLPRLDLGDPIANKAASVLVKIEDKDKKALAAVVIGKEKYGLYGPGRAGSYVRRDGKDQAWLADRAIEVPKTALDWVAKQILDVPRDQIAKVTLRPEAPDAVTIARPAQDATALVLAGVPQGRAEDAEKVDELAGTLSGLQLEGVKPAKDVTVPADAAKARFETVDGLTVLATLVPEGTGDAKATWAKFDVSAGPPMAAAAAGRTAAGTVVTPGLSPSRHPGRRRRPRDSGGDAPPSRPRSRPRHR